MTFHTVVLGLGIAGSSVLDALARMEPAREFLGIDVENAAFGTTSMSAGTYSAPGSQVTEKPGATRGLHDVLSIGTRRIMLGLAREGYQFEHDECGALEISTTEFGCAYLENQAREMRGRNGYLDNEFVDDPKRLAELEPLLNCDSVRCALSTRFAGSVHPVLFAEAFCARARANGAHILEGCEISDVVEHRLSSRVSSFFTCEEGDERAVKMCDEQEKEYEARQRYCIGSRDGDSRNHGFTIHLMPRSGGGASSPLVVHSRNLVLACGVWTDTLISSPDRGSGGWIAPTKAQGFTIPGSSLRRVIFFSELYAKGLTFTHPHGENSRREAFHTYCRNAVGGDAVFCGYDRVKCKYASSLLSSSSRSLDLKESTSRLEENVGRLSIFLKLPRARGERNPSVLSGSYVCFMPLSHKPDHEPLYGALTHLSPALYLATGLGANGIERGPRLGEILAKVVLFGKDALDEDERFAYECVDPERDDGYVHDK